MSFFVALRKELLEQWRTYRLLVVTAVFVTFGLLSPLTARFMDEILQAMPGGEEIGQMIPEQTVVDAVGQYVKNLSQFGVILALLMGMGAVAREKDKGTAALVLSKPMSRAAFLAAKFVALGVTFAVSLAAAAVAGYYYTALLFEPLDILAWLALNGLMLLFLLVYVALTLLASTLTRSQALAGGLAFAGVIVIGTIGITPRIAEFLPAQLLTWGAGLLFGADTSAWPALGVSVGIIVAALVGAWAVFERQEL